MEINKDRRFTKAHRICFILFSNSALTRVEVMECIHLMERKSSDTFSPTSNNCYWSPTGRGNGGRASVIYKGLVKVAGKRGRAFIYELTEKGESYAKEMLK